MCLCLDGAEHTDIWRVVCPALQCIRHHQFLPHPQSPAANRSSSRYLNTDCQALPGSSTCTHAIPSAWKLVPSVHLIQFHIVFFFFFWPHWVACGILVPWPGIEPESLAVRAPSPNHWTARELPHLVFRYQTQTLLEPWSSSDFALPQLGRCSFLCTFLYSGISCIIL